MKLKINHKLLSEIKYEAHQVYTKGSVDRVNREDFLAYAYLIAVTNVLSRNGVEVELVTLPDDFTSIDDQ